MIAARRRPTTVLAIFLVEAIFAWLLAAPWASTVASAVGAHPDGDRAVWWRPGMPLLLDLHEKIGSVAAGLVGATAIGLAVYAVLGVFLRGALLASLAGEGDLRGALARGAETFSRLLAVGAISLFVSIAAFVLLGVIPAYGISARTSGWLPQRAALVSALPVLLSCVVLAFVFAATDLARARVVADDLPAAEAIAETLRDRRAVPAMVALSAPRWVASLGLLGWGAAFSTAASSLAAIFVVHQLIAFLRVGLRASVLARALRLAAREAA